MSFARPCVTFTVWQDVPPSADAPPGAPARRYLDERGEWTFREREAYQFQVRLPTLRDRGAIRMAMHEIAGGGDVARGVKVLLDVETTLEQLRSDARERAVAALWGGKIPEDLSAEQVESTVLAALVSDPRNNVLEEMFDLHEGWRAFSEWTVLVQRAPAPLRDLGDLPPHKEDLARLVLSAYRSAERDIDLGNSKPSPS